MGPKQFVNLWDTYWVLGPEPRFNLVFMHLDFWDPDPGTQTLDLLPKVIVHNLLRMVG